jgi:hypothetical protein
VGHFVDRVRASKIPQPTQRSFQRARWAGAFAEGTADTSDKRLFEAGVWTIDTLDGLRAKLRDVPGVAADPATLKRAYVGFCNRMVKATSEAAAAWSNKADDEAAKIRSDEGRPVVPVVRPESVFADLAEAMVDCLRYPIARVSRGEVFSQATVRTKDPRAVQAIIDDALLAHHYESCEQLWEEFLWSGWFMQTNGDRIVIMPGDADRDLNHTLGVFRRDHLLMELTTSAISDWPGQPDYIKEFFQRRQRIVSIERDGKRKQIRVGPLDHAMGVFPIENLPRMAAEELYFDPLLLRPLPQLGDMSVRQLLDCWSVLAPLARLHEARYPPISQLRAFNSLLSYAPVIPRQELVLSLVAAQDLDEERASLVVDLLTFGDSQKDDLWKRPFVRLSKDELVVVDVALHSPNLIRSIEGWLARGGIALSERGELFEQHVRSQLHSRNRIPSATVVERDTGIQSASGFEQIDLLVLVGKTILVGEVKCSIQPSSPIEVFNHYDALRKGCAQAARKLLAVKRDLPSLLKSTGWNALSPSEVILCPVVVTNLPLGAATSHHGVPIVDFSILSQFFAAGGLDTDVVFAQGQRRVGRRIKFYDTPSTAGEALPSYLAQPPQVSLYLNYLTPRTYPLPMVSGKELFVVKLAVQLPNLREVP